HVTLAGLTNCGCNSCSVGAAADSARITSSFNGTYVLTQVVGTPCRWAATFAVTQMFDTTGAGVCDQTQQVTMTIQLDKTGSNTWQFAVFLGCSFAFSTPVGFAGP